MKRSEVTPLDKLKNCLLSIKDSSEKNYKVPGLWAPIGEAAETSEYSVNPADFFIKHIEAIENNQLEGIDPVRSLNSQIEDGEGGSWIEKEVIYNIFVRLTTAYDHDGDGIIGGSSSDKTLNSAKIRESGTFLKAIALLGHISSLGATVVHLLPVTAIGSDGNKGELGSPYAIKNPYKLEQSQADPLVPLDVNEQFKAFVQACHMLGIRVVTEFVFRTASKDSEWIKEHPEWFYWIDNSVKDRDPEEKDLAIAAKQYGNPIFSKNTLEIINKKVSEHDFENLPVPDDNYRNFFTLSPKSEDIKKNESGQLIAKAIRLSDRKVVDARIPGAFADWPPDDNQPPWGDVTYLRMFQDQDYENPEFNYIAYNTIRMYDNKLAKTENATRSLWDTIRDLIPHYQREYGIDGVMVDMGHAVPVALMQEIIQTARKNDPNFAFLSENFEITEESVKAGYNAVIGYAWWVEYKRDGMYDLLDHVGNRGVPLAYFGAVENHNTPRAASREGGLGYSKYAFLVNSLLPGSIPFLHSGQELGEEIPVNTGLDFSSEQIEKLRGKKLALFDMCSYNWTGSNDMLKFVKTVLKFRNEFKEVILNPSTETFGILETGHADVICFIRQFNNRNVVVVFNRSLNESLSGSIDLSWCFSSETSKIYNRITNTDENIINGKLEYSIEPCGCILLGW